MTIDWFTVVVEAVNFLILVWLLQRFLYRPIISAMEAREQNIANRLQSAQEKNEQAEAQATRYFALQQQLEDEREQYLEKARADADTHREELVARTRWEVDTMRRNLQLAVQQESDAFLSDIEKQIGRTAIDVARQMLDDLSDADMEERIINRFVAQLRITQDVEQDHITQALAHHTITVDTSFQLSTEQRELIENTLANLTGRHPELSYRTDPTIIAGIRLSTGQYAIAWSIADHIAHLQQHFAQILEEQHHQNTNSARPDVNNGVLSI
ncbi:MAG: F0F1 ATP synthase subunit B [Chloroflexota bacterium]